MKEKQMKKVWILIIVIVIFIWPLGYFLIWKQCGIPIGEKIEASAIVTLVFATIFYAIQTERLVREEKKKRDAELWARTIEEFCIVFLDKVKEYLEVFLSQKDLNQMISVSNEISRLISVKGYMISKETIKRILELSKDFLWVGSDISRELIEKVRESLKEAVKIINDEKKRLDDKLRKLYGIER